MPKEIERKFLIDSTKLPDNISNVRATKRITQAYLSIGPPSVRVRVVEDLSGIFVDGYFTVKGKGFIEREEIEHELPSEKAYGLLLLSPYNWIVKKRNYLKVNNLLWEIDEFEFEEGVPNEWLAEVELETADQDVELPEWIVKEVSEDSRYTNASIAKNGWPNES